MFAGIVWNSRVPQFTQTNLVDIYLFHAENAEQILVLPNVTNPTGNAGFKSFEVNDTWFGPSGTDWNGVNISRPYFFVVQAADKPLDGTESTLAVFNAVRKCSRVKSGPLPFTLLLQKPLLPTLLWPRWHQQHPWHQHRQHPLRRHPFHHFHHSLQQKQLRLRLVQQLRLSRRRTPQTFSPVPPLPPSHTGPLLSSSFLAS